MFTQNIMQYRTINRLLVQMSNPKSELLVVSQSRAHFPDLTTTRVVSRANIRLDHKGGQPVRVRNVLEQNFGRKVQPTFTKIRRDIYLRLSSIYKTPSINFSPIKHHHFHHFTVSIDAGRLKKRRQLRTCSGSNGAPSRLYLEIAFLFLSSTDNIA